MSRAGKRKTIDNVDETDQLTTETVIITDEAQFGNGSAADPSITFINDSDSGYYLKSDGVIGVAIAGTEVASFDSGGLISAVSYELADGTEGAPSIAFTTDPDTGIYKSAGNTVAISAGGTKRRAISTTNESFTLPQLGGAGTDSAPTYSFSGDPDTGIYNPSTGHIGFVSNGVEAAWVVGGDINADTFTGIVRSDGGTATVPGLSFNGDSNTGIFSDIADNVGISTGGTERVRITANSMENTIPILGPDGSSGAPAYSFATDPDTGFYSTAPGAITVAVNGVDQVDIDTTRANFSQRIYVPAGTVGAPAIAIAGNLDTGIYFPTVNNLAVSTAGTVKRSITNTEETFVLQQRGTDGGSSAPTYSFTSSPDSGMFSSGSGNVDIAVNGSNVMNIEQSRIDFYGLIQAHDGAASDPSLAFTNDPDTGIYSAAANTLGFATGGTLRLDIETTKIDSTLPITAPNVSSGFTTTASSATPITLTVASTGVQEITGTVDQTVILPDATTLANGHTFTLIVNASANIILTVQNNGLSSLFVSSDTSAMRISVVLTAKADANGTWDFYDFNTSFPTANNGVLTNSDSQILTATGTASLPAYSFTGDPDTGIYQTGVANTIGIAAGGTVRKTISSTAETNTLPVSITNATASSSSITGALIVTGGVGVTGAINTTGGILALNTPGYGFQGSAGSMYAAGGGNVYLDAGSNTHIRTAGVSRLTATSTALTATVPFVAPLGAVGTPSYSFTGDPNTGIYSPGANQVTIACDGATIIRALYNTIYLDMPTYTGAIYATAGGGAAAPPYSINGASTMGMYYAGTGALGFSTTGTNRLTVADAAVTSTVPLILPLGSTSSAAVQFTSDPNTGIYSPGSDQVAIVTGGTQRWFTSATGSEFSIPLGIASGTAAAPSLYLVSDSDGTGTGLYRVGANDLGISTNGTLRFDVSTTAVTSTLPIAAPSISFAGGSSLANYVEGTWTPVLTDLTNNFTMGNQIGVYTRVGRLVFFTFSVSWTSLGSATGQIYMDLPVALSSGRGGGNIVSDGGVTQPANVRDFVVETRTSISSTHMSFTWTLTTSGSSFLQASQLAASGSLLGFATYNI